MTVFTPTTDFGSVYFCAAECARQRSGELSVAMMYEALCHARTMALPFTVADVCELGRIVDPVANPNGQLRTVPVSFANGNVVDARNLDRKLAQLCEYGQDGLTPAEFYRQFEGIHPFADGNGRVGAILYNVLMGTLDAPVVPPEYSG